MRLAKPNLTGPRLKFLVSNREQIKDTASLSSCSVLHLTIPRILCCAFINSKEFYAVK